MAYAEKVYKVVAGKTTTKFTWRCRYRLPDGTWGSEPGFPTKRKAEEWGDGQERQIRAGTWIDPSLTQTQLGEWARTWMKAKSKRGRTVGRRWDYLDAYILPRWEHTHLNAITWFDVDTWSTTLPCEDVTRGHVVTLMSQILTGAVDAKYLVANPLFGRRRSTSTASPAAPAKSDEERWATPEVVLQVAQRLGPARGLAVISTAFLGLRLGELLGLHRDNALLIRRQADDGGWFECPVIRIDPEVGELAEYEERDEDGKKLGTVVRLEPPKNDKSARRVDVPPFLEQLLRYHMADWQHPYLFCTPSGAHWRRSNWNSRYLRPAADGRPEREKRRGVSFREGWEPIMPGLTMRDLRHTHDTYQAQIGVKEPLAFEQAGHKRSGIKGVYQHPTPEMRQERLDGLQEIYERAMGNLGLTTLWGRVDLVKRPAPVDLPNISQMISARSRRAEARGVRSRSRGVG